MVVCKGQYQGVGKLLSMEIKARVTQSSVLESLVFSIDINDMPDSLRDQHTEYFLMICTFLQSSCIVKLSVPEWYNYILDVWLVSNTPLDTDFN